MCFKVNYEIIPKYPDDWNTGDFEVVVNHCYNCHEHKKTTRHFEYVIII